MTPPSLPPLRFGRRSPVADRPLVMATVALDLSSDGDARDVTLAAVAGAIAEGADIVHIDGRRVGPGGGLASVAPGHRVAPLVASVRARYPDLVISVGGGRADAARLACAEGADLLTDTGPRAGGRDPVDPKLAEVAAEFGVGVICAPAPVSNGSGDRVGQLARVLGEHAERLTALGVPREGVLIDPTRYLAGDPALRLEMPRRCEVLVATGWPVLLAPAPIDESVGAGLDGDTGQREDRTLAAVALAAATGARVFRTADVAATRRTVEMVASILGTRPPAGCVRGLA